MSIPHDLQRTLDGIARGFQPIARNPSSGVHKVIQTEASKIAENADCDDVSEEDADDDGAFRTEINPPIDSERIYFLHEAGWVPLLRRSDRAFDRLCQEFLDAISNDPRATVDDDDALTLLDEALGESFWPHVTVDGNDLKDVYDEVRNDCADAAEYSRDPYAYYGVSRRDFMASRTLTASDRSRLVRLASTMTAGDEMRRAILAGLSKSAMTVGTVRAFLAVATSKLTQYDKWLEARRPNAYRLGHYIKALDSVRDDVKDVMDDDSPEALGRLRASLDRRFDLPPISATIKQIDEYIASGRLPSLVRQANLSKSAFLKTYQEADFIPAAYRAAELYPGDPTKVFAIIAEALKVKPNGAFDAEDLGDILTTYNFHRERSAIGPLIQAGGQIPYRQVVGRSPFISPRGFPKDPVKNARWRYDNANQTLPQREVQRALAEFIGMKPGQMILANDLLRYIMEHIGVTANGLKHFGILGLGPVVMHRDLVR